MPHHISFGMLKAKKKYCMKPTYIKIFYMQKDVGVLGVNIVVISYLAFSLCVNYFTPMDSFSCVFLNVLSSVSI